MTQITVAKLLPPGEGKKSGAIETPDGKRYRVASASFSRYQVGQSFDVAIKESSFNGQSFFWLPEGFTPPAVNANTAPPAPAAAPAPRPAAQPNGSARLLDARDVQITTIALMKSFIETGKFGLTDLPMLEGACIPAAKRIVGASQ